jgi:hypothetical protein
MSYKSFDNLYDQFVRNKALPESERIKWFNHFERFIDKKYNLKQICPLANDNSPEFIAYINTITPENLKECIRERRKVEKQRQEEWSINEDENNKWCELLKNEELIPLLKEAEQKAFGNTGKTINKLRCAAFVEYLYDTKRYIKKAKPESRRKTMNEFSLSRYKIDISNALASKEKNDREKHQRNSVNGQTAIKNCF